MSDIVFKRDGLTEREVETSRRLNGSNSLSPKKRTSFIRRFLEAFSDPIIKVLCAALIINLLFCLRGEGWFETAGIALSIFLSSFVSTLSEYGSESAFLRLQAEAGESFSRVMRGGKLCEIPCGEIVVGDAVLLGAGDVIPADGFLAFGSISVDQSAINGESHEREKKPSLRRERGTMAENTLFRGSVVTFGEGVMEVSAVGDSTVFGQMAASLTETPRESPLKTRLSGLASTLSRFGYLAALLIGVSDLCNSVFLKCGMNAELIKAELLNVPNLTGHLLHAVTLSISIVIMAVPEGLPMMITVVLSGNMFRMLRDKVMVRKLAGIETAGSMTVLFTDKTGTLTEGKPKILSVISPGFEGLSDLPPRLAETMYISGMLNTSARLAGKKAVSGNATDRILLKYALSLGINIPLPEREGFVPFTSELKYSAAAAGGRVYVKGAAEKLLESCVYRRDENGAKVLFSDRQKYADCTERECRAGHRLLSVCTAESLPDGAVMPPLCFEALVIIGDSLRREAAKAVKELRDAGVSVIMVTGDNRDTAAAVAEKCGILYDENRIVLTGEQLSRLSDKKIAALLPNLAVVSRALPGDKSRLVRIAQEKGEVCGMTGDGINDAPALKAADVGFALGCGTDVAKEAGDIVITDDNISSICRAVLYGRTILRSIRRFIVYQLTMNMCAVGVSLIGPFINIDTPVTVAQILWTNLIMDTLAGLAFSGEPPLPEYMRTPPERKDNPLLTRGMKRQIAATALFSVLLCLAFLTLPQTRLLYPSEKEYLTGFFALFIFGGIAGAFTARSDKLNIFSHLSENRSFILVMSAVAAVQLALIYLGGDMFRSFGLTLTQLLTAIALSVSVILFDLLRKLLILRPGNDKIKKKEGRA